MTDPDQFQTRLADAIQSLYGDRTIIGDPDLLDFADSIVRSSCGA
jgi:hypothetical protein